MHTKTSSLQPGTTTTVDRRVPAADIERLVTLLDRTADPVEIGRTAARLGATGDRRAIRPLLSHLGDPIVQDNAEVETAVCRALMALDVMCMCGSCGFCLRPRRDLPEDVVATIRDVAREIPWPYFGARRS